MDHQMRPSAGRRSGLFVLHCLPLAAVFLLLSCGPGDVAIPPNEAAKPREVQRVPVASTNLQSVGYDAELQTLTIEFRSGSIYEYEDVPPSVHADLMAAKSHGKYFHGRIRDAGYTAHRLK